MSQKLKCDTILLVFPLYLNSLPLFLLLFPSLLNLEHLYVHLPLWQRIISILQVRINHHSPTHLCIHTHTNAHTHTSTLTHTLTHTHTHTHTAHIQCPFIHNCCSEHSYSSRIVFDAVPLLIWTHLYTRQFTHTNCTVRFQYSVRYS